MLQRSVLIAIAAGIALTVATTAAPPSDVSRRQPLSGCVLRADGSSSGK